MTDLRRRLVRGLISGLLHEVVVVILSFVAMIVLVRLLTPEDYGQAAAAVGILGFINAFRGAMFVEHALQHAKDDEPDWDTYFAIVGVVQIALCGVTVLVALACRLTVNFAWLGPLLQVASLGLLLEWPAQVAAVKLRRDLQFDRLKIVSGISVMLRLASSIALAWLGLGAMALIISGNVLAAVPLALTFLAVDRWRPRGKWLFLPHTAAIRPVLVFGAQQIAVGFVQSLRIAAESVVLTRMFGTVTFGLLNRALALYQSTIGRLGLVFVQTAYPLLPMERGDRHRYAHRASRFIEVALILSIPGAAFLVLEGAAVSRLLYGSKWVEADPFLAPAAIALAATALVSAAANVVMGMGRVRSAVIAETIAAAGGLLALLAAALAPVATPYIWALAVTQVSAAGIAFAFAAPLLEPDWRRRGLWPALAASLAGSAGLLMLRWWLALDGAAGLLVSAMTYATLAIAVLALTARPIVLEVMRTRNAFAWKSAPITQSQAQA